MSVSVQIPRVEADCENMQAFRWEQDLVSVVMPAFNQQERIEESVRSIMAQTYRHWELWIVDDASTDQTLSTAQRLAAQDSRIHILRLRGNSGAAMARNAGIAAASGRYLSFLDADDLWAPEKLQIQLDFMRRHKCSFSHSSYERFGAAIKPGEVVPVPPSTSYKQLLRTHRIGCSTVMLDREQIATPEMRKVHHEDYATWLRILKTGHSALGIPSVLARYRVGDESLSSNKLQCARWTWNIYRKVERLSLLRSIECFTMYAVRSLWVRLSRS